MVQVTGTLTNPLGVGLENIKLTFKSEGLTGQVPKGVEGSISTGVAGAYDFTLIEGSYEVSILRCNASTILGKVTVDANTPATVSLIDLLVPINP